MKFYSKQNILNNFQYGFRSDHSTSHAILDLNEKILENKDKSLLDHYPPGVQLPPLGILVDL